MASQPLPRFLETQQTRADHARKLETVCRETSSTMKRTHPMDPADTRTLRGIPAIGRGVAGCIPGMQPDRITFGPT